MEEDLQALRLPEMIYNIANSWIRGDVLGGYEDPGSFWRRKNLSEMTQEGIAFSAPYTYIEKNLADGSDLCVWIMHRDCDLKLMIHWYSRWAWTE